MAQCLDCSSVSAAEPFVCRGQLRSMPARMPYIRSLNGLRSVAVVLLLLFSMRGDLFFVLSGFLITSR